MLLDEEALHATLERFAPIADTVQQNPRSTIEPRLSTADENEKRAMEVLARVSMGGGGGLELEQTLGEGGMGIVRLATQIALGRKVAVKSLKTDARDQRSTLKLLREAWITGALEHPNVVPVYDLGVDEQGGPRLVLKRIEGVEWAALIADEKSVAERFGGRSLLEWNLSIFQQVAQAVHFAHSRGIVHRDLKPENVMIGAFGEVYVLDWGIAVSLNDDGSGRLPLAADAREMAGTPAYMAPEMLGGGSSRIGVRTDVYLLGGLLYEILCSRPPHEGETLMALVQCISRSQPSFPDLAPAELVRICQRALDGDPDARFESAEQLRLAVQGYLQHRGSLLLAGEATQRLEELRTQLTQPDEMIDRDALYNLFGAARFGFQQALRAWRENEMASAGLREATLLLIEHELAADDARAAAALLAELQSPPAELLARVAESKKRHVAEQERRAKAEQDFLPEVGRRTRTFLGAVLGIFWTTAPLVNGWVGSPSIRRWVFSSLGSLVALGAVALWARETLMKTAFNRRMGRSLVFLFVAQLALAAGASMVDLEITQFQSMLLFGWFFSASTVAITLEWRIAPAALGYLLAFLVTSWQPQWVYYCMSLSNAVLTVNLVTVWRPRERFLSEENQRRVDEFRERIRERRTRRRGERE